MPGQGKWVEVVLYSRPGCHLCDEAWVALRQAQERFAFSLEVRNVEERPEWEAAFGQQIPVVAVNGQVRFRAPLNVVLLTRLLRAETRRTAEGGR